MHAFDVLAVVEVIRDEFGISQPAVSQHLEVDAWLEQFRGFWEQRLDALGTELARSRPRP